MERRPGIYQNMRGAVDVMGRKYSRTVFLHSLTEGGVKNRWFGRGDDGIAHLHQMIAAAVTEAGFRPYATDGEAKGNRTASYIYRTPDGGFSEIKLDIAAQKRTGLLSKLKRDQHRIWISGCVDEESPRAKEVEEKLRRLSKVILAISAGADPHQLWNRIGMKEVHPTYRDRRTTVMTKDGETLPND